MAVGALLSIVRCSCRVRELFLIVVEPWCSFLIVIHACHHPLDPTCNQVLAVVGMGGGLALSCWGGVSVTWHAYGGCWMLTWWVSPFWGLSVSLCALLAHVDSLTSRLNGEEGVLVAVGVH
jgi:hypothetical protein